MDGLQRMWEMITHTGLSDLMPTARMTRVEQETQERQMQADAAEVEQHHEGSVEVVSAPKISDGSRSDSGALKLSGRMRQFTGSVPEVFEGAPTTTAAPQVETEGRSPETTEPSMETDATQVDGDEIPVSRLRRRNSVVEAEIRGRMNADKDTAPGMGGRRRIHGAAADMRRSSEIPGDEAVRTRSGTPRPDRSAPEVSADGSVEGIAGRSRRWLEMSDDAVIADMMGRREAMVERGR